MTSFLGVRSTITCWLACSSVVRSLAASGCPSNLQQFETSDEGDRGRWGLPCPRRCGAYRLASVARTTAGWCYVCLAFNDG